MEHEVDDYTNRDWFIRYCKSPGDLRRLVVIQTPVKAHPPTLMLKKKHLRSKNNYNNNISHEKTWMQLRKGNLKRGTEYFL